MPLLTDYTNFGHIHWETGSLAAALEYEGAKISEALLFGISATDPVTLVAVLGLLTLVGGLASYLPARRAVAINPVAALRAE